MKHFQTVILSNERIARDFFEMRFLWDESADPPLPGQFITLRVSLGTSPLLRRPFALSAYDSESKQASIIFRKIGRSTQLLAGKTSGDSLDCIGPLGNSFAPPAEGKRAFLVAGGIGLGPVIFWAASLQKQRPDTLVVFGCRTREFIPNCQGFVLTKPIIVTEDGSEGFKGTTVDFLKSLPRDQLSDAELYCCGPMPMLKACHDFAFARGIRCWVSIEQVMACGVGACMGCVVKMRQRPGFARVCKDGPVFDGELIQWT
jgi:dihydroorotate dehydrogenase electron transfer subunit